MKYSFKFDKFAIFTMITSPFISIYASPVKGLNLSDILIILSIIGLVAKEKNGKIRLIKLDRIYISIVAFAFFNFLINIVVFEPIEIMDIALRTMRYIIYFTLVILIDKNQNSREIGFRYYRFFAMLGTLLIIVQNFVVRLFGYYISGFIPFLPLSGKAGIDEQISNIYNLGGRPFSFFAEPSAYAIYVAVYLAIEMFYFDSTSGYQKYYKWLLTFGLLLSGSTTGVILSGVLWILYFRRNGIKNLRKDLAFYIVLVPIAATVLLRSNSFQSMLLRVAKGSSSADRFRGFLVFCEDISAFNLIFGHGMNDNVTEYYLSDIPRLYYYWGTLGILFMVFILISLFKDIDNVSRIVLMIIIGITVGASWIWGPYLLLSGILISEKIQQHCISDYRIGRL